MTGAAIHLPLDAEEANFPGVGCAVAVLVEEPDGFGAAVGLVELRRRRQWAAYRVMLRSKGDLVLLDGHRLIRAGCGAGDRGAKIRAIPARMAGNGIRSAWAECAPGRRQRPRSLLSRARVFALLKRVALFMLRRLSTELVLASGLAWIREMLSLNTSMTNCPLVLPAIGHQCVSPENSRSKNCSPVQRDGQRMRANRPQRPARPCGAQTLLPASGSVCNPPFILSRPSAGPDPKRRPVQH